MKQIDLRLLGIAGAILAIAFTAAGVAIYLFRYFLPQVAADTIWDELTGPTIAALVIFGIKSLLFREKVFHLMVAADVPGLSTVNLYLLRRRRGWGMVFMPRFRREALINDRDAFIRNIFWWGVYGVDDCRLCIRFGDSDMNCRYVDLPRALYRPHATIRVRLSELNANQPLVISHQHVE
jgi:hypothetical protein